MRQPQGSAVQLFLYSNDQWMPAPSGMSAATFTGPLQVTRGLFLYRATPPRTASPSTTSFQNLLLHSLGGTAGSLPSHITKSPGWQPSGTKSTRTSTSPPSCGMGPKKQREWHKRGQQQAAGIISMGIKLADQTTMAASRAHWLVFSCQDHLQRGQGNPRATHKGEAALAESSKQAESGVDPREGKEARSEAMHLPPLTAPLLAWLA